jgi:hypothetical protein
VVSFTFGSLFIYVFKTNIFPCLWFCAHLCSLIMSSSYFQGTVLGKKKSRVLFCKGFDSYSSLSLLLHNTTCRDRAITRITTSIMKSRTYSVKPLAIIPCSPPLDSPLHPCYFCFLVRLNPCYYLLVSSVG